MVNSLIEGKKEGGAMDNQDQTKDAAKEKGDGSWSKLLYNFWFYNSQKRLTS